LILLLILFILYGQCSISHLLDEGETFAGLAALVLAVKLHNFVLQVFHLGRLAVFVAQIEPRLHLLPLLLCPESVQDLFSSTLIF
jgi:hypothetical protein